MIDSQARLDELTTKLRARGYRLTPQRRAVIEILTTSEEHPSADMIYARVKKDFPMTSLATVYKTVTLLKEMGEVVELSLSDDCNRYDVANPAPHPHLICVKCKSIVDLEFTALDRTLGDVAAKTGYKIVSQRFDFFGVCPECQMVE